MKIIVCVKQVPDTAANMAVEDGKVSWGDAPLIINPWDEFAVEAALNLVADQGGEVTALCLGKAEETEAIKHALAMGADAAVLVSDPLLKGVDNVRQENNLVHAHSFTSFCIGCLWRLARRNANTTARRGVDHRTNNRIVADV